MFHFPCVAMLHHLLIGVSLGQALKGEDTNNEHYANEDLPG